jgi:hypothetical protein
MCRSDASGLDAAVSQYCASFSYATRPNTIASMDRSNLRVRDVLPEGARSRLGELAGESIRSSLRFAERRGVGSRAVQGAGEKR